MRTRPTTRSTILAIVFAALATSCAADDPLPMNETVIEKPTTTTTTEAPATTTTSMTTTSTTTTTTTIAPALTGEFSWGERSDDVRTLQVLLGVEADGVYGPATRAAHQTALEHLGLPTDDLPARPIVTRSGSRSRDDVPAPVLAAIENLWPETEWNRALTVAFCESGYRVDAANPTSSARGVFQLLIPWRRDPGSGRQVWGWEYTADGEKLSAAAGLGISEADATWTVANITVAHAIWQRSGWSPWNASRHCWAGS